MNIKYRIFILLFIGFLPVFCYSQVEENDTSKVDRVLVDFSDFGIGETVIENGETIQKRILKGSVELRQGDVYMYCDSAIIIENNVTAIGNVIIQQADSTRIFADSLSYLGDEKIADLFGNEVILEHGTQQLYTDHLNYNLHTKVAKYFNGANLINGKTQLTSKRGYYYVNENEAFFKDSVRVVDPEFVLWSDTLKFNTEDKIVHFLGPTRINLKESQIYCEDGFYNTETSSAEFTKNAQFTKEDQKATAKIIRYDGLKKEITLEGDAHFIEKDKEATADVIRYEEESEVLWLEGDAHYLENEQDIVSDTIRYDSKNDLFSTAGRTEIWDGSQLLQAELVDFDDETGLGKASGNVVWVDTVENITIVCEQADYDKASDYILASGNRPMLITVVDKDSMFLTADTLFSYRAETEDSSRILLAYNDVRVLKSDLQAVCDSMSYSLQDSIFEFFQEPIIWSDTTQFLADTIRMLMKDDKIDRIFLYKNSFIINSSDEVFFNQIKGKNIIAYFKENELDRMLVNGNAESIYFMQDEEKAYIGVNKTICSEMLVNFGNNQVLGIKFYKEPTAVLTPMQLAKSTDFKLEGFRWLVERRPLIFADLFE